MSGKNEWYAKPLMLLVIDVKYTVFDRLRLKKSTRYAWFLTNYVSLFEAPIKQKLKFLTWKKMVKTSKLTETHQF